LQIGTARAARRVPKSQGFNFENNYLVLTINIYYLLICFICYYLERYLLLYLTLFITKEKRRDSKTSPPPLALAI